MPSIAPGPPSRPLRPSPLARSVDTGDGVILMHVESGKYFALNPAAERIWNRLRSGDDRNGLAADLVAEYGIEPARAEGDVDRLLQALHARGLVVDRETEIETDPAASEPPPPSAFDRQPGTIPATKDGPPPTWSAAAGELVAAWLAVVACGRLLRRGGFPLLRHDLDRRRRTAPSPAADPARVASLCRRVDQASRACLKRAWCLQRSAAAVRLLRARGVAADLVIGIRRLPFGAHAWVEVDGEVVNDDPALCRTYRTIDRC